MYSHPLHKDSSLESVYAQYQTKAQVGPTYIPHTILVIYERGNPITLTFRESPKKRVFHGLQKDFASKKTTRQSNFKLVFSCTSLNLIRCTGN